VNTLLILARGLPTIAMAPAWVMLLLKITAFLLAAWAVHGALGRLNPRWRVLVWRVAAVGLVALPSARWLFPALEIRLETPLAEKMAAPSLRPIIPPDDVPETEALHLGRDWPETLATHPVPMGPSEPPRSGAPLRSALSGGSAFARAEQGLAEMGPRAEPGHRRWQGMLLAVWLSGIGILLFRFSVGHYRLGRMIGRAGQPPQWIGGECRRVAAAVGCRGGAEVRQSALVRSPLLCGLCRPVLLLPPRMCEDSYRSDLPAILAHELTHVRFRDLLWNAGLHLLSIVLWFHPLAWRMRRAHLAACELVCDAVSAALVGNVAGYCRTLARVAVESAAVPSPAGIAMARTSSVSRRLSALRRQVFSVPLCRRRATCFGVAAILAVAMLGALHFGPAAPSSVEPVAAAERTPPEAASAGAGSANKAETPSQAGQEHARAPSEHRTAADKSRGPDDRKADWRASNGPDFRPMQIRVIDSDQKPVASATITVRGMTSLPFGPIRYPTDREGIAVIRVPREDLRDLQVLVWDAKHVTVGAAWDVNRGGGQVPDSFSFVMELGTVIGGIVRDAERKPVLGVEVAVEGRKTAPGDPRWVSVYDTVKTDAEGKWQINRIPKNLAGFDLEVKVKRPDPAGVERFPIDAPLIEKLRARTAELVLPKGIAVEGTVTDPQGTPVAGAAVGLFLEPQFRGDSPRTKTDQNGRFRFAVSQRGEYTLVAAAKGYAPDSRRLTLGTEPQKLDLALRKGEWIRLRVVDQDGKPVPQAIVSTALNLSNYFPALMFDYQSAFERDQDRHMLADADGRWSRLWIPEDVLTFYISKPGYAQVVKRAAPSDAESVVTLEAGGWSVAGRVVDRQTKAPIPRFRVTEGISGVGFGDLILWRQSQPVFHENGEYRIAWDTADDRRVVHIEADGYYPSRAQPAKERDRRVTFNVELRKGPNVAGVVRSPDGGPLAGADVILCTPGRGLYLRNGRPGLDQLPLLVRTGADGRFSFPPEPDRFRLVAIHEQGIGQVGDQAGTRDITLERWAGAEGTLRIGDKPAVRETVKIEYEDLWSRSPETLSPEEQSARRIFTDYQTLTDDRGHFAFERVWPRKARIGHYVKVSQEGMMTGWRMGNSQSVKFIPGQTLTVDLSVAVQSAIGDRERAVKRRHERDLASSRKQDAARDARLDAALEALRARPPLAREARIERVLEIMRNYSVGKNEKSWATAIRELIEVGKPAVPRLIQELDRTEREQTLRALGFVLRGIGDPRTVPALIRAIPRTYPGGGCDFGLTIQDDPDLLKFMQQHDNSSGGGGRLFTYGRPIREVMPALEKITGRSHGWLELNFADQAGQGADQDRMKRAAFLKHARKWADWWSKNWRKYVHDPVDAQLDLTREALDRYAESIPKSPHPKPASEIPCGPNVVVGGGVSNRLVRSFDESQPGAFLQAFLDLDSGRLPNPPQDLLEISPNGETSKELLAWAEREGVDLITVKTALPGSDRRVYAFLPLGMKVWRIDNDRFDNLQNELCDANKVSLPEPWKGLMAQVDEKTGKFDEKLTVSFLFITKEGTCGALQIQSPISRELRPGMPVGGRGGWHYKFIYERSPEEAATR
jgi:beta-lactamase regulating signal transducer with metallopeptidase domain